MTEEALANCEPELDAEEEWASVMDIVFDGVLKYRPKMLPDDDAREQDSLHARVAAWEEEHPGKSFWDGAMADMEEDI